MAANVKDFGAAGNNTGDDTQAFLDALATGLDVYVPAGKYRVGPLTVSGLGQSILGDGMSSMLIFVPTSNAQYLLTFQTQEAYSLSGCGLRNIRLASSAPDVGITKHAIDAIDVSVFHVTDVQIGPWAGVDSIGLHIHGRELVAASRLNIATGRPIVISQKPDNPVTPVGLDHACFRDLYLLNNVGSSHPNIEIENTIVQNISFDGYQAWVRGAGGFRWVATDTVGVSVVLSIHNVRTEQMVGAEPSIRIELPAGARLWDLDVQNCLWDHNAPMAELTYVHRASFRSCLWAGTGQAIAGNTVELREELVQWVPSNFL